MRAKVEQPSWKVTILVLAGCALPSAAQDNSLQGPQTPITLGEALSLAEQYNPRLAVAGAQIDGAQAAIVTARTRPNPEVNYLAGGQSTRLPTAAGGLMQHWGYSQQLETPAFRRNRIEAAMLGREASAHAMDETRLLLRATVKQIFFQALRRKGEIELAEEALKLVQDFRQRVQVQVDVGEVGRLELTRAEAEVSTAQTFLRSAQLRHAAALAELRALVGAPLGDNLDPHGSLDPVADLGPFVELRQRTLDRHPAVARARAEILRANARLKTEMSLRTPQPVFIAEFEQMPDLRFARAGISIPVPFFNRRQGPIAEATAALSEASALLSTLQLELSSAVERAYNTYQIAKEQVVSIEAGPLRGAQSAVEGAEAAFRFGERGIIEVLDAQRVLRNIRSDYLNAQFDCESALVELEQVQAIEPGNGTE